MLQEKYMRLDDIAAPNGYAVPPSGDDLDYVIHFRQICRRYNIDFSKADEDEREFIMRMLEKSFYPKQA